MATNTHPQTKPIDLPPDILLDVLSHVIRAEKTLWTPSRLSLVCKAWHQLVFTSPHLWTEITFAVCSDSEVSGGLKRHVQHFLRMSKGCQLSVTISVISAHWEIERILFVHDLLRDAWSRVCRLEIHSHFELDFWALGSLWSTRYQGAGLVCTTLNSPHRIIECRKQPSPINPTPFFPEFFANTVHIYSRTVMGCSLTSLTLDCWDSYTFFDFWGFLRECRTTLQHLSLNLPKDIIPSLPQEFNQEGHYTFERLTSISMCFEKDVHTLLPFFNTIAAPALDSLRIRHSAYIARSRDRLGDQLRGLPRFSASSKELAGAETLFSAIGRFSELKDLRLYGVQYPENAQSVFDCLRSIQGLKTLYLFGPTNAVVAGWASVFHHACQAGSSRLLPNLRNFCCSHAALGSPVASWGRRAKSEQDSDIPQLERFYTNPAFMSQAFRSSSGTVDVSLRHSLARDFRLWNAVTERNDPHEIVDIIDAL